mmetsp:Transcript_16550/g.53233  ORF Transcript_16550/g.53233 Transcript_16550/m.53233 type:complete len:448 (-) Transcript_16550:8-1351(-)
MFMIISRAAARKGWQLLCESATSRGTQPLRRAVHATCASVTIAAARTEAQCCCSWGLPSGDCSSSSRRDVPPAMQVAAAASGKRKDNCASDAAQRVCTSPAPLCRCMAATRAAAQVVTGGPGVNSTRSKVSPAISWVLRNSLPRVAAAVPHDSANPVALCSTAAQARRDGRTKRPEGAVRRAREAAKASTLQVLAAALLVASNMATSATFSHVMMAYKTPTSSPFSPRAPMAAAASAPPMGAPQVAPAPAKAAPVPRSKVKGDGADDDDDEKDDADGATEASAAAAAPGAARASPAAARPTRCTAQGADAEDGTDSAPEASAAAVAAAAASQAAAAAPPPPSLPCCAAQGEGDDAAGADADAPALAEVAAAAAASAAVASGEAAWRRARRQKRSCSHPCSTWSSSASTACQGDAAGTRPACRDRVPSRAWLLECPAQPSTLHLCDAG